MRTPAANHTLPQSTRQAQIAELIGANGFFTIEALAQHFNVTAQTIRSDVNRLCRDGQLRRYHGGAGPVSTLDNATFEKRRIVAHREKLRIAAAIAAQIPDRASVFVHYGTTMEAAGAALRDHTGLLIVTNNLSLANNAPLAAHNQVLLAGGKIAPNERCTYGEGALAFLRQFNADFGLISARSIEADGTVYEHGLEFAETARVIIENARQVFLAVDSRKFHGNGLARVGHVRNLSAVFTDKPPPAKITKLLADHGVALHVAKAD